MKLPAEQWLKAVQDAAAKNPKEAAEIAKSGPVLPGTVRVAIAYQAAQGHVELESAELFEAGPTSPNLLPNGGFEEAGQGQRAMPLGWTRALEVSPFPRPALLHLQYLAQRRLRQSRQGPARLARDPHRPAQLADDRPGRRRNGHVFTAHRPEADRAALHRNPRLRQNRFPGRAEHRRRRRKGRPARRPCVHSHGPHSIGSNDWRLIRQVFRPRRPVESIRVMLCARGVNGYTLDDTGQQPQNNVVGQIWWDDVKVFEPESTDERTGGPRRQERAGCRRMQAPCLVEKLDLGERLLGENYLTGTYSQSHRRAARPVAAMGIYFSLRARRVRSSRPALQVPGKGRVRLRRSLMC